MTAKEFAKYLNENEEKVQELLSSFTLDDLLEHLKCRIS